MNMKRKEHKRTKDIKILIFMENHKETNYSLNFEGMEFLRIKTTVKKSYLSKGRLKDFTTV